MFAVRGDSLRHFEPKFRWFPPFGAVIGHLASSVNRLLVRRGRKGLQRAIPQPKEKEKMTHRTRLIAVAVITAVALVGGVQLALSQAANTPTSQPSYSLPDHYGLSDFGR